MNLKEHYKSRLLSLMNEDMAMTVARKKELEKMSDALLAKDDYEGAWDVQDKETDKLRSDKVYGLGGKVVDKGVKGLGWAMKMRDLSDKDIANIQAVVNRVGQHIVAAPDDPAYATSSDDIESTETHPVYRRMIKVPKGKGKGKK